MKQLRGSSPWQASAIEIFPSSWQKGQRSGPRSQSLSDNLFFNKDCPILPISSATAFCSLFTVPGQSEIDEPGEGRIIKGFPELALLLIKPDEVMILCFQDTIVISDYRFGSPPLRTLLLFLPFLRPG